MEQEDLNDHCNGVYECVRAQHVGRHLCGRLRKRGPQAASERRPEGRTALSRPFEKILRIVAYSPMATTSVTNAPSMRIFHQSPEEKALRIWAPAFVPARARNMSKPNSARTESAVFGSTVTSGPIRPILPMMRPTIRIPAAYPKAKWAPPKWDVDLTEEVSEGKAYAERHGVDIGHSLGGVAQPF